MKRLICIIGMLTSFSAAVMFFSDYQAWGFLLLAMAYANLQVLKRVKK